jgi:hypothetical protein
VTSLSIAATSAKVSRLGPVIRIRVVLVAVLRQHGDGAIDAILAPDHRLATTLRAREPYARCDESGTGIEDHRVGIVSVAQKRNARPLDRSQVFRLAVIIRDDGGVRRMHVDEARVDDVPHAGHCGRVDGGPVLTHARTDPRAGDQQQPVGAGHRRA